MRGGQSNDRTDRKNVYRDAQVLRSTWLISRIKNRKTKTKGEQSNVRTYDNYRLLFQRRMYFRLK